MSGDTWYQGKVIIVIAGATKKVKLQNIIITIHVYQIRGPNVYSIHLFCTIRDTHWSFMQNIFYSTIFWLDRNLPARKVNLQLGIICASRMFSARKKLSYFNSARYIYTYIRLFKVIKITKMYISFIDLYLSINTLYIFQKWTTGIFSFMEGTDKLVCSLNLLVY